jgi:probable blue pigment (indigoidine) exporter
VPTAGQALGFAYLAVIATAVAFALWFRGIANLAPQRVAFLVLLSPVVATVIGWLALGQALGGLQLAGMLIALASMVAAQLGGTPARRRDPRKALLARRRSAAGDRERERHGVLHRQRRAVGQPCGEPVGP